MSGRRIRSIAECAGAVVLMAGVGLFAGVSSAQALTKSQETCVNTMNKSGSKVTATQGKENSSCVKDAGKGKLTGSAQSCLTADRKGKIGKAKNKTADLEGKKCTGTPPSIAFTGSAITNQAGIDAEVALAGDVFGTPMDPAIIDGSSDKKGAGCQAGVVKAYEKYGSAYFKDFLTCKKATLKGFPDTIQKINDCIGGDAKGKLGKARGKILSTIQKKCSGVDLQAAYPGTCQASATSDVSLADCLAERTICRTCQAIAMIDAIPADVKACDSLDDGLVNGSCDQCGNLVVEAPETCDDGGETAACNADCTIAVCGDGVLNVTAGEQCDDGNTDPTDGCTNNCTICGDGVVTAPEECDDGNLKSGDGCSSQCTCSSGSGEFGCQDSTCPNMGELTILAGTGRPCTTNTDCLIGDGRLPAAEGAATCDTGLGRCVTVSELDTGWTGIAHDSDVNDAVVAMGNLVCPGPGPTCGLCAVVGVNPTPGNCRCENDNQAICDQPFEADADDCGGDICNCYFGPPIPLSSGNTPACALNKFAKDVSGTANVDTGEGLITAQLAAQVFLGIDLITPCPYCSGDVTVGDGVRDGTCVGGDNDGLACDTDALNWTFPAPGGSGSSLDCFPSANINVSGAGLRITLDQTTGTASMPPASVTCGFVGLPDRCTDNTAIICTNNADCGTCATNSDCGPIGACDAGNCQCAPSLQCSNDTAVACITNTDCGGCATNSDCGIGVCDGTGLCSCTPPVYKCQCGLCSDDQAIACTSNGDCGTCTTNADCPANAALDGVCDSSGRCSCERRGNGDPLPNMCNGFVCDPTGGGEGVCTNGPTEMTCDGVVRANGKGFISCNNDAECSFSVIGIDAGSCTIAKLRECFLDPVSGTGVPDANKPVSVATFCIPPTGNTGINGVAGLPGPARAINQTSSRLFCASDPNTLYEPGVGGCP